MKVVFKKLHPEAVLPSYAHPGDNGLDLVATTNGKLVHSLPNEPAFYYVEYGLGLSVELPPDHVGLIFPRSSISKTAMLLANHVAVIDSNFRGEIRLRFKVDGGLLVGPEEHDDVAKYKKGDKIGQLVIIPLPTIEPEWTEELSETERGSDGFGSTGK